MSLISNLDVRNNFKGELCRVVRKAWVKRQQSGGMPVEIKYDGSPLTLLDREICRLIKSKIECIHSKDTVSYYSEEEQGVFTFPVYVVDPIDGTKEFVEERSEFVVSIGLMNSPNLSDPLNEAWILNPLTGFEMESTALAPLHSSRDLKLGLVSRTEWDKGLYADHSFSKLKLSPLGSIAYKLALFSAGACDFVISRRPKNVWDIAAGTILLTKQGFAFYENGKQVKELVARKYEAPLIWCHPDHFEELNTCVSAVKKP